jgi:chaperonin GroES
MVKVLTIPKKYLNGGLFMSVPIQPLADYVVAQQEEAETKTKSGLYIPGGAQEKPKVAKVLAVGKDVKNVKVGERIIYGGYSNTDVKLGSETYMLVKEENIFATVK